MSRSKQEPDAHRHAAALEASSSAAIEAPTLLEASIVSRDIGPALLDRLIAESGISVVAFTHEHAVIAREAHLRYGRGSGSNARLNFGDCISYAMAKVRDEPLLFKGDDFHHTDVTTALT